MAKITVGSIVEIPGPVFGYTRSGPRHLWFYGVVTSEYQAKGGPAVEVSFVTLNDKVSQDKFLVKRVKPARFYNALNCSAIDNPHYANVRSLLEISDETFQKYIK